MAMEKAIQVSSYLGPFLTFGWYLLASFWSVFTLQNLDTTVRKRTRQLVFFFEAIISILFAAESGTIIYQLLNHPGPLASTASNIYAQSHCLIYLILPILLWATNKHQWYPHYGAWIVTLILDIVTSGLLMDDYWPANSVEWYQVALHGVRIVTLCFLLSLFFITGNSKFTKDEEQTPLLKEVDTPGKSSRYGGTDAEETTAKRRDEALDKAEKELREKVQKLEERLKENGDWFTYIKNFAIFIPFIWPHDKPMLKINMIGVGLCILVERALTALKPLGLGAVANYLIKGQAREAFLALGVYAILRWLDSSAGISGISHLLWLPVEVNAYARLDAASYNHVMSLSCDFHDAKQTGEMFQSMSQGQSVVTLLESILYSIGPQVIDLIVAGFYLYFLFDAYLVLIAFATIVIFLTVAMGRSGHQQTLIRQRNASQRQKWQVMYDTVGSWRTVIYFNQSSYSSQIYDASVRLSYQAYKVLDIFFWGKGALESLILILAGLAAFSYAVYSVVYGDKTVGSFIALQLYWTVFTGQLPNIPHFQRRLLQQLVNAEALLRLHQTKPTVADGPNEFNLQDGHVKFDRVGFSYSDGRQIIHDLSFHARSGQTIAMVGETGAGKSTLLKLLFRFYDVETGSIMIDGQDIRDVTLKSLRESIGVVPQDPTLFNDTIMANVRYARLDASDEEVMDACKAAAVHDKILTFKDGYATKVGERGVKLSGGELQRVAIARAILKNPKIILLDEATSSVDTDTESKIQEALLHLTKGRTTFVVAHRLSTIQNADRIILIHDGTIVEQGTLKQLLKLKGRFHNLWNKQFQTVHAAESSRRNSIADSQSSSQTKRDSGAVSEVEYKDVDSGKATSS